MKISAFWRMRMRKITVIRVQDYWSPPTYGTPVRAKRLTLSCGCEVTTKELPGAEVGSEIHWHACSTPYFERVQNSVSYVPGFHVLSFSEKCSVMAYIRDKAADWEGDQVSVEDAAKLAVDQVKVPPPPDPRFRVVKSTHGLQGLPYDVQDFSKPDKSSLVSVYETVCLCFSFPDAAKIAEALNRTASSAPPTLPVAWMYDRAYGSGLSFTRPADYHDAEGNLVQPTPLYKGA
jgi:hypothetical protein